MSVVTKRELEDQAASVQGLGLNVDELVMKLTVQTELAMLEKKIGNGYLAHFSTSCTPVCNQLP